MQVNGNTILITGGGSGIGRGLAEAFLKLGNNIVIAGRDPQKLADATEANPGMESLTLDVTDPASIADFAADAVKRFPELNVLINNAGAMRMEDLKQSELADAALMVETNLMGPMRLTAALMPHLLDQSRATVLNVTSGLAFVPMSITPTYCATKAALHSYSISLRDQLKDSAVDVIEIIPPYVQTYLTGDHQANDPQAMPLDDYIADTMSILTSDPDVEEVVIDRVAPLRNAEAEGKFAEVFGFLASLTGDRGQ